MKRKEKKKRLRSRDPNALRYMFNQIKTAFIYKMEAEDRKGNTSESY